MVTVVNKNVNYHYYPRPLCRKAISFVFDTLEFDSPELGQLLHDSYRSNVRGILEYAHSHKIDEIEHILAIRDILLKSNGVHDITR